MTIDELIEKWEDRLFIEELARDSTERLGDADEAQSVRVSIYFIKQFIKDLKQLKEQNGKSNDR